MKTRQIVVVSLLSLALYVRTLIKRCPSVPVIYEYTFSSLCHCELIKELIRYNVVAALPTETGVDTKNAVFWVVITPRCYCKN
jgi:hypothetical protein